MGEQPASLQDSLLSALEILYERVVEEPRQPLNQLAEEAVVHWIRVLGEQDNVQPRLNERGYAPSAFHFRMEDDPRCRLDHCDVAAGQEAFEPGLERRLAALAERLEAYFHHSGYRSSSDQCDQVMLELARCSRFVNTWAWEGELAHQRHWRGRARAPHDTVHLYRPIADDDFLGRVRWQLALWEPLLNAAIVGWEENQLDTFDRAMRALQHVLCQSSAERAAALYPPGYPLRPRGLPRQKVVVFEPGQRPLRSRSVLSVRYHQLREKIAGPPALPPALLDELASEVAHFTRMVETNLFMLASRPAFFERGRAGVPIIRGRPTLHPFLLDPAGFFKKAVLFHNHTYTVAGGGLDLMYVQLRQLERLCKFERWSGWARPVRAPLEASLIAWDENRWVGFTEGLLQVAVIFRRNAEGAAD